MHYSIVQTGPTDERRLPDRRRLHRRRDAQARVPTDRPVITIDVDDIDAALAKIEELGGMAVLGRQDVGDMGYAAYFKDVEGNLMGLWRPDSAEAQLSRAVARRSAPAAAGARRSRPSGSAWSSIIARNRCACSTIRGSMWPKTSRVTVP